jgi:hypothetical protein
MSDDLEISEYGKASVEAGQGYQAMPDPREMQERADERAAFDRGVERLNAIDQAGEQMPAPVQYNKANPDGTRSDERSDERLSITPSRGAADLSEYRAGVEASERILKDIELADQIDKLRSEQGAQSPQQPQAPAEPVALDQQTQTTQSGQPLPPELQGEDSAELVKIFQEHPKLLESLNAYSYQNDQKVAAAQQQALQYAAAAQQQAEQFVQANAKQAIAGIFVRYPELQNLSQQELPLALNLLQRSNPERHAAIMHEIAGIQGLLNESNRVARVQQEHATQQYHQQFHTWGGEEDSKFVKANPEMADSATASGVMQRTRNYVNRMGFTDHDIARAWNGQAHLSLRDARVQSMLYDAMRYREAVAAVPAARVNKPVRVVTPGPSGQIASQDDADLRSLSQRLTNAPTGTASVRAAAELLAARRAKSR